MATSREYIDFILEQTAALGDVTCRSMMGEYLIYYKGKLIGDVCDNRLLVKPVKSALELLPNAPHEPPYAGAKDMILVEDIDDGELLTELFRKMYDELPAPKPKKKKEGQY